MIPMVKDFQKALEETFQEHEHKGHKHVDVRAGELHRRVGGYPGPNHRMPVCCDVMLRNMRPDDGVLQAPPKGRGASLEIRYVLPRQPCSTLKPAPKSEAPSIGDVDTAKVTLFVTHCGKEKKRGVFPPNEMYLSSRIQRFVKRGQEQGLPWAILSAKYGLFFPDEKKHDYDVTMRPCVSKPGYFLNIRVITKKVLSREESNSYVIKLREDVRHQLEAKRIQKVTFYTGGRQRGVAYIAFLHHAKDNCTSTPARQPDLEQHLQTCPRAKGLRLVHRLQDLV